MSRSFLLSSAEVSGRGTEFNEWLTGTVREHGEFTALVILTEIGNRRVAPLCSTYLHITGDQVDWEEIKTMFESSGQRWDGAAFFPTKARSGGPIDNPTARLRLAELEAKIREDRMVLNEGHFFDMLGRRIKIEPIADA
jgi:hypothetical protein